MTNRNRRAFLATASTIGTVGLAGCLSEIRQWRNGTNGNDSAQAGSESEPESTPTGDAERPALPGESLADFETLDGWMTMVDAGAFEADADDPYVGSQSGRLVADEGTAYAGVYTSHPRGLDLSGKSLSLAAKFTGQEQLTLTIALLAPNSDNTLRLRRTLTGPTDRWVRVDFGAVADGEETDLSAVREIQIVARRRGSDDGSIACSIDDLRAIDRPEQGAVTLLFDGTLASHYTTAFEQMEAFDFAGVEAVIPEAVGNDGRLTIDAMETMADAGWDMAARPRTGSRFLHEYSTRQQEGAIRRTKGYLENNGFEDGARHFVTPRNVLGTETIDLVREHHEQAFRYGGGPNGMPATDPHNLGVFSGHASSDARQFVEFAERYDQHAVLHFEEIGDGGLSEEAFRDLLEVIDDRNVRVLTASELLATHV